ncbi:MAG: hypothetical protein ACK57R_02490 [Dolichospermum sp.]|nr:hypothetical protein [Anabaena sp. 49628_E55]
MFRAISEGREQGTGNNFNCLDILNFANPTKKNAIHFETPLAKTWHFLW